MRRIVIIFIFIGFLCCEIKAQLSTGEIPYSWGRGIEVISVPKITMSNLDIETLNKEDLENEGLAVPFRFGFSHDVNLNLENSGVWQTTPDGGRLWHLKVYSPDAISLNLLYDKFWLPEGAKFFVYSEDLKQHIGAFTSDNNKGDKDNIMGFATGFLFTNSIILEYYEPAKFKDNGIISINQVISGYRYIYDNVGKENQSKGNDPYLSRCHNDVICPVGSNYKQEKNAIAYFVMGEFACTGSLLNTTAGDNRPVFLSADHCFKTSASTTQWIFYWNYEAPTCGGDVDCDPLKSTTGATLLAKRMQTDFMLLNLIENPAINPNILVYYLGWDRTTSSATSGVVIHHPKKSPKKISITTNSINNYPDEIDWTENGTLISITPANTHWEALLTNGTIENGSSGAPLLSQNKRVIGQLHGGGGGCPPNNFTGYYGRFDVSWNGDGTSSTRLKDWLDPLNTNVTYLNGNCNQTINNQTYNTGSHVIAGCVVTISNTTIETNTTVRIHGQESVVMKPGFHAKAGSNVKITAGNAGQGQSKSANITDDETTLSDLEKLSAIEQETTDMYVYPNPNDGNFSVKIIGEINPYTIEIFNSSGGMLGTVNCNEELVGINRNDLNAGIYYVKLTMGDKVVVKKVIVQ